MENIGDLVAGEIIVTFTPGQAKGINELLKSIVAFADKYGITAYRLFPSINACAYQAPEGQVAELIERLKQEPGIENAEPGHYFRIMDNTLPK